jgi:uncharacterized circularly permuted ATP-grasp superfamily protein
MTDFITDTWREDDDTHYKLIFNTNDKEVFNAMQTLARRMVDRKSIHTNYEYLCTRTPEELSHVLAAIKETCEEESLQKLDAYGIKATLVTLSHDINALMQLVWLNKPYTYTNTEVSDESDIDNGSQ